MTRAIAAPPQQGQLALLGGEPESVSTGKVLLELPVLAERDEEFYWSASRLRKMLQCPRQFRYSYVDKLNTVPGAPMVLGRILHEIICSAHAFQMETGGLPPVDELLEEFERLWPKVSENVELRYPKAGPEPDEYLSVGREMIRVFRHVASLGEPPLAVELPFNVEVEILVAGEPRTVELRGVIDRLDEVTMEDGQPGVIIVDYKSGRKKLIQADVREEIQLTIYALAVQRTLGLPVAQVELFGLRDGESVAAQRRAPQIEWLVKHVLPYAQEVMEGGEFPARPGYWCKWCEHASPCEEEGIESMQIEFGGVRTNGTTA